MSNVATVRDLIKALQKFPMETPVFGYNNLDECDFPIEKVELCSGPIPNPECEDEEQREWFERWYPNGSSPYYCKGDSTIEMFWTQKGVQPVLVLRMRNWEEM